MSDARRVMITVSDPRMPDYGEWDEQPFGRHALLPWEEYERLRDYEKEMSGAFDLKTAKGGGDE